MIKIKALNETVISDTDDFYVNIISTEAQEQIALNAYNEALKLLFDNKHRDALTIFQDLINTELLNKISQTSSCDGQSNVILSLKYSCFKNIANINAKSKEYQDAIYNFWEAVKIDDEDVILWYRIGTLALKISNLELSCFAFAEGLKRNKNHWPCLDNIITTLYTIPDYINCLLYISVAVQKDPSYKKGFVFCQKILKDISLYKNCCKNYYNDWLLNPVSNTYYNKIVENTYIDEADNIYKKWIRTYKKSKEESSNNFTLEKLIAQCTWIDLGNSLLTIYDYIVENNLSFSFHIKFQVKNLVPDPSNNIGVYSDKFNKTEKSMQKNTFDATYKNFNELKISKNKILNNDLQNEIYGSIVDASDSSTLYLDNTFCSKETNKKKNSESCTKDQFNLESLKNSSCTKIVSNTVDESDEFNENTREKVNKVKKRRRSSLCFLTQWAWSSSTKRSSRIRTSSKKEYEQDGNFLEETLKQILPADLLSNDTKFVEEDLWKNPYDSADEVDTLLLTENEDSSDCYAKDSQILQFNCSSNKDIFQYFTTEQERLDVENFIIDHTGKYNIIMLIGDYLKCLTSKWSIEWPNGLSKVFIQLYLKLRIHVPIFSEYSKSTENYKCPLNAETILLFCELYTDDWLCTNNCVSIQFCLNEMGIGIPSEDLGIIIFYDSLLNTQNHEDVLFLLRSMWLKANIFLYQGDPNNSSNTLKLLLQSMKQLKSETFDPFFKLRNCKYNSTVCIRTVQRMLLSIQRSERFHEIKNLYKEEKYRELVCVLKDTFNFTKNLNQFVLSKNKPLDRIEYLQILLDSLWKLEQYEDCYVWAEASLNESWNHYLDFYTSCTNEEEPSKWLQIMLYSLEKLHSCITEVDIFVMKNLSSNQLSRLVQNLVNILCHQLDVLEKNSKLHINTVLPWILLHYILQYEEDKRRAKTVINTKDKSHSSVLSKTSDDDDYDDDENIPASVLVLFKAHKFLGRHGLCCMNNGKLLLFIMKSLIPKLNFPSFHCIKQKLKEPLEQVIYCLYGHPAKSISGVRSKPKNLDEHGKSSINLTWQDSQLLFEYYKPENFPTFESKKNESINADTVTLFKKICTLFPKDSNPDYVIENMNSYLLGYETTIPSVKKLMNNEISYIYYLIADHYFKTASWANAIKYYTSDLCLHPNELNSWAGLAMSTSTQMETWLNNFHPNINEEKYLLNAKIAQRSYQHAVDLDPTYLIIWTEYGNFLYTVHSFCSRLLKQESDSLSMEKFKVFENQKEEMLALSKNCFLSASNIFVSCQDIDELQDERWLYQYMLAKIAEKKNEEPSIFLNHYLKASQLLHENRAQYPKRICHTTPQTLSVEALEVYYRVHASILKYLEQHEGKQFKRSLASMLERNLKNFSHSPFMNYNSSIDDSFINRELDTCKKKNHIWNSNTHENDIKLFPFESVQEIECNTNISKCNSRKRSFYDNETNTGNDEKRPKLDNISDPPPMQDVVALTHDLIKEVCKKVAEKPYNENQKKDLKKKISHSTPIEYETLEKRKKIEDSEEIYASQKSNYKNDKLTFSSNDDNKTMKSSVNKELQTFNDVYKTNKFSESKASNKKSWCRRDSQESTTTTQTTSSESNNSSSTSSEETSTTDDSSDSSSSSDSDSESVESEVEKRKKYINEDPFVTEDEVRKLIKYCLAGLEECILRFPEHYKSIYRLAHYYFYSKYDRNITKCKQLLLETYVCQFHKNKKIQGLFAERKNTNFFNGIWRIPIHEIDRPGSFASHMSKCILLLMQVLKETNDSKMLFEICIQLRKTPDADKKYLRDNEREQLSIQALALCLQCLRNRIKTMNMSKLPIDDCNTFIDNRINILLDVYHTYRNIKNVQEYQISELPKVKKLLEDAYTKYTGNPGVQGNIFDLAKEFCRIRLRANKTTTVGCNPNVLLPTNTVTPLCRDNITISNNTSFLPQDQKLLKGIGVAKHRGKQPGISKSHKILNNETTLVDKQSNMKQSSISSTCLSNIHNLPNNLYPCNPFIEANIFTSMIGSNFGVNMIDSALNYFNQVEIYQNILQQYQNNSSSLTSNMNYKGTNLRNTFNKEFDSKVSNQQPAFTSIKERPDISITPVTNLSDLNNKSSKPSNTNVERNTSSLTIQLSKSTKNSPIQQSSSHKIFEQQPVSLLSEKEFIPIASMSKNKNEEQHAFSRSLPVPIEKSSSFSRLPQITTSVEKSLNVSTKEKEISLQHKLKKNIQRSQRSSGTINLYKKESLCKQLSPVAYANDLKNTSVFSTFSSNSSGFVNSVSSKHPKISSNIQKSKSKILDSHVLSTKSAENFNNIDSLSMLSQLQQHPHIEIFPQTDHVSLNPDRLFDKLKMSKPSRLVNFSHFNTASANESTKHVDINKYSSKSKKKKENEVIQNDVEIITLDD